MEHRYVPMETASGTLLDIRGILSRITGIPSAEYSAYMKHGQEERKTMEMMIDRNADAAEKYELK